MTAPLFLSARDGQPMYRQIVEQVVAKVIAGDWPAGTALPSIRELAAASGVSVITVKRAYLELERAGVINTWAGKGSFVAPATELPRQLLSLELEGYLDAALACAAKLGLSTTQLQRRLAERAAASSTSGQQD